MVAAQAAEARGFHSLWLGEHVVLFDEYAQEYPYADTGDFPVAGEGGMVEPFTTLAFLAGRTSRIRLGTGGLPRARSATRSTRPRRSPTSTGCRAVGSTSASASAGCARSSRRSASRGSAAAPATTSTSRSCAGCGATRCRATRASSGRCRRRRAYPKPVQQPHPPIHIGGNTDVALRRVVRLGADWLPVNMTPEELAGRRRDLARSAGGQRPLARGRLHDGQPHPATGGRRPGRPVRRGRCRPAAGQPAPPGRPSTTSRPPSTTWPAPSASRPPQPAEPASPPSPQGAAELADPVVDHPVVTEAGQWRCEGPHRPG